VGTGVASVAAIATVSTRAQASTRAPAAEPAVHARAPELVPDVAPEPIPEAQKNYSGVLMHGKSLMVAPRNFPVSDCPKALNTVTGEGDVAYMRCLSLDEQQKLLARAKCNHSAVNGNGTRLYQCDKKPGLYVDGLPTR
jgi:hypothetical protein